MKKLFTLFAAALVAVSASAQTTVEGSKAFDNVYVGINGGVATKMTGHSWMKGLNPNAGVRIGKNITPVFGLAIESNAYFSNKPWESMRLAVRALNTSLLGTVNLSNMFAGYKGEPRLFEVGAVYGIGWGHVFMHKENGRAINRMTSKAGLDFQFNLGSKKQWQIYVEPSVTWAFNGMFGFNDESVYNDYGYKASSSANQGAYNINNGFFQLNAGVIYKFKNHNGSHNFTIAQLRDQGEIDALNQTINDLRNELAKKPKEIVKEVVKEAPAPKDVCVENLVLVTFAQGKSAMTKDAKAALDGVKEGSHVQIVGTASPEGSKAINDKISQARADEVAKYLKSKGVVVDEATGKGVQGNTSNRLAVVYVK